MNIEAGHFLQYILFFLPLLREICALNISMSEEKQQSKCGDVMQISFNLDY